MVVNNVTPISITLVAYVSNTLRANPDASDARTVLSNSLENFGSTETWTSVLVGDIIGFSHPWRPETTRTRAPAPPKACSDICGLQAAPVGIAFPEEAWYRVRYAPDHGCSRSTASIPGHAAETSTAQSKR